MNGDTDRARDALHAIPPDLPRDAWVRAGMAAQAAGLDFEAFDQWSASAPSYTATDCRDTWRSIKPGKGITAATLFKMAADHGWRNGHDKQSRAKDAPRPAEPPRKVAPGKSPADVFARCEAATNAHPCIMEKRAAGVPLESLRMVPSGDALTIQGESMAGALVIPVTRADGTISTLQLIPPPEVGERLKAKGKPGKLNLPGYPLQGWFTVGELAPGGVVYVCEGAGQAWACWQATGHAAVCCFGWGRVSKVTAELRQRDASARLVLVPDRGKEQDADKIAFDVGAAVARMPEGWEKNCDVSDLAQRDGLDVLVLLLEGASEPPKPEPPPPLLKPVSVLDVLTNPSPPPQFVWDGYLPRGTVSLLGGHGGTGKSVFSLMLGVCAALGRPLFGADTAPCRTLYLSLEDGQHIVRHRLAHICRTWAIDPEQLRDLLIVDGTEHPELFVAENRGAGATTATYGELHKLVQDENIGLVTIDNASDSFGGDEIQRRQVRAFMRSLAEIARSTNCAVLLLVHVDKATSRNRAAAGGEAYSGSTAWHNSARSRLFLTRAEDGTLTLEHQKSNLGKLRESLTLTWPDGGLPMLDAPDLSGFANRAQGRADDARAATLLKLIAELEGLGQYCSPATTSRNHVHAMLRGEPAFLSLKLKADDTRRIVNQCQRAKWLEPLDYRSPDRKPHQRWAITPEGRIFAGLPAPTAPTCANFNDGAHGAEGGAPTAPTSIGGVGEGARTQDGAVGAIAGVAHA